MSDDSDVLTVNPAALGFPRGYSNGILAPAGARTLFVAGQVAWNADQEIVSERFPEQFEQSLRNVVAVVEEAGGQPHHLASLTIYVTDRHEYTATLPEVGIAYRRIMGRHFPAMALVEVKALLEEGAKVEIQATAVLP